MRICSINQQSTVFALEGLENLVMLICQFTQAGHFVFFSRQTKNISQFKRLRPSQGHPYSE